MSWIQTRTEFPAGPQQRSRSTLSLLTRISTTMADEDLIDYNEEEEQTEIVAEKESKK